MGTTHLTDRNFSYEYGYWVDTTTGNHTVEPAQTRERMRRLTAKIGDLERVRDQVAIFDFDGEQAQRESVERVADAMRHYDEELRRVSVNTENLVEALRPYRYESLSDASVVWVAHS